MGSPGSGEIDANWDTITGQVQAFLGRMVALGGLADILSIPVEAASGILVDALATASPVMEWFDGNKEKLSRYEHLKPMRDNWYFEIEQGGKQEQEVTVKFLNRMPQAKWATFGTHPHPIPSLDSDKEGVGFWWSDRTTTQHVRDVLRWGPYQEDANEEPRYWYFKRVQHPGARSNPWYIQLAIQNSVGKITLRHSIGIESWLRWLASEYNIKAEREAPTPQLDDFGPLGTFPADEIIGGLQLG